MHPCVLSAWRGSNVSNKSHYDRHENVLSCYKASLILITFNPISLTISGRALRARHSICFLFLGVSSPYTLQHLKFSHRFRPKWHGNVPNNDHCLKKNKSQCSQDNNPHTWSVSAFLGDIGFLSSWWEGGQEAEGHSRTPSHAPKPVETRGSVGGILPLDKSCCCELKPPAGGKQSVSQSQTTSVVGRRKTTLNACV